ncbi:VOC family protein [Kibdelosporangium philippinense]|uniref:VOC family protein n=1 Tax=Kibdelosporangium philippinense TaxID=211113 RepID=A0ABS8ZIB9_9PSEU|nr:VOC family protein [Kibdelosporangium philippinense]MCE7007551.1 VOC family protein [Kibdelosporangium philippinense]
MIYPTLRYRDAVKAVDWLVEAFGFEKSSVNLTPDGTIAHAELRFDDGIIMLNSAPDDFDYTPSADFKYVPASLYIAVSDVDAHYDRAKAAGAEITMPLTDMDYGSREYSARDFEGNHWHFGTYRPV